MPQNFQCLIVPHLVLISYSKRVMTGLPVHVIRSMLIDGFWDMSSTDVRLGKGRVLASPKSQSA